MAVQHWALTHPAYKYVLVTPDDNNDLADGACKALLVSTSGTVNLMDIYGDTVNGVPVFAGYNPLQCKRVLTGGTATGIFALY